MTISPANLKAEIRERRDLILGLDLDIQSLEKMKRTAGQRLGEGRTKQRVIDLWGIRAALSFYQNGGAC